MRKYYIFIIIFGLFFIFGGITSINSETKEYQKVLTAKYKQEVVSEVLDVRKVQEKDDNYGREFGVGSNIDASSYVYLTEEVMPVGGQMLEYQGRYNREPGYAVNHTLISSDGENWVVNDTSIRDVFVASLAGIIFMIVGAGCVIIAGMKFKR